jgi:hypothetical protein
VQVIDFITKDEDILLLIKLCYIIKLSQQRGNKMKNENKITALELSKVLDLFKDDQGNYDADLVQKVGNELKNFGPFYLSVLGNLVEEILK